MKSQGKREKSQKKESGAKSKEPEKSEYKLILQGKGHSDERGIITFNNEFDASQIKRIYTIENKSTDFIRGWQGHKIEQRWFAAVKGRFEISVIKLESFENPERSQEIYKYTLEDTTLTFLHVAGGSVTAIQALEPGSKLLVLADYHMGEVQDEYRFDLSAFEQR